MEATKATDSIEYACLFCISGREESVAQKLRDMDRVRGAMTMRTIKRRTNKGVTTRREEILLPGYVFVAAERSIEPMRLHQGEGVIRPLCSMDGDWRLNGSDRAFSQWLFARNGLLEFSQAYREGDRVKIATGPLKDMEGSILKLDKRNTSAEVFIHIGSNGFRIWLGYDLIDKPQEKSCGENGTGRIPL